MKFNFVAASFAGLVFLSTASLFLSASVLAESQTVINAQELAPIPETTSNNAVALYRSPSGVNIVTALGLGSGKSWSDTLSTAWRYSVSDNSWMALSAVPGDRGRLAASAVSVAGSVYLFGGYVVAEDGSEESTPGVFRLKADETVWQEFTRMPVPVEDSVLLVHQDRFIYMVSGWHDLGNVNLVQVLDTRDGSWQQATPWPGDPVFGHAGGMSAGHIVVCDGVRIIYPEGADARLFEDTDACWYGEIDVKNHRRINWRQGESHPGTARYRMAAGADDSGRIWFVGGSDNPYNFNGMGYNGEPSVPDSLLISYGFDQGKWQCHGQLEPATMDHRGLLFQEGWFYLVGGMRANQKMSDGLLRFKPPIAVPCPAQ